MMLAAPDRGVPRNIRQWCVKFGQTYANGLRRRRPQPGDTGHLDEVFLTINGQRQYLWRAVDQDQNVLDILVTPQADTKAATRLFRKLFKGLEYVPRVVVTDMLGSYHAARRQVVRSVEHHQSKYLNNRAENSHQPTRQRERAMTRFTTPGTRNGFRPRSGVSPHSGPVVTCSPPRTTAARWPTASVPGMKAPG
jgi:putative transposase